MARAARLIVLDTHAWLWWTSARSELSKAAQNAIVAAEWIGVSTISCWEVAMLVNRGRIELDRELEAWIGQALAQDRVEAVAVDSEIAVAAAQLPAEFPGDPADRLIFSSAHACGATLITKDRGLRDFDPQLTLW